MDETTNNLNYISCPSCLTLFKPKASQDNADNYKHKCICCGLFFTANTNDTVNNTVAKKITQPNLKYQANLKNISLPVSNNKSNKPNQPLAYNNQQKRVPPSVTAATSQYLKYYKLKSRMLFILWLLMPLFFLDLTVSTIIEYKDHIAQNYKWRSYIEQFCNIANCELPVYKNLKYILIEDNALVGSETKKDAIQLHAIIKNASKYDQLFPDLNIKFSDANGKFITEKKITAEQYKKNNNLEKASLFAKNSKQYISILLDDPGLAAVNYEIDLTS